MDPRYIRSYAKEIRRIRDSPGDTFARYIANGVKGVADMGGPLWTFERSVPRPRRLRLPRRRPLRKAVPPVCRCGS